MGFQPRKLENSRYPINGHISSTTKCLLSYSFIAYTLTCRPIYTLFQVLKYVTFVQVKKASKINPILNLES